MLGKFIRPALKGRIPDMLTLKYESGNVNVVIGTRSSRKGGVFRQFQAALTVFRGAF